MYEESYTFVVILLLFFWWILCSYIRNFTLFVLLSFLLTAVCIIFLPETELLLPALLLWCAILVIYIINRTLFFYKNRSEKPPSPFGRQYLFTKEDSLLDFLYYHYRIVHQSCQKGRIKLLLFFPFTHFLLPKEIFLALNALNEINEDFKKSNEQNQDLKDYSLYFDIYTDIKFLIFDAPKTIASIRKDKLTPRNLVLLLMTNAANNRLRFSSKPSELYAVRSFFLWAVDRLELEGFYMEEEASKDRTWIKEQLKEARSWIN